MAKRRKLHSQLILDVGLAFAVLVLLFIVADFWYEHYLIRNALDEQLKREIDVRLNVLRGEIMEQARGKALTPAMLEALFRRDLQTFLRLSGYGDHVLAVFDSQGGLITSSGGPESTDGFDRNAIFRAIQTKKTISAIGKVDGERSVFTFTPLLDSTSTDLPVVAALAYQAPVRRTEVFTRHLVVGFIISRLVGFTLILIVLVILITVLTRRLVVTPIQALILHQHAATQGDLRRYEGQRPENEIGDMFVMFDRVLDALDEKIARLKKLEAIAPKEEPSDAEFVDAEDDVSFLPGEEEGPNDTTP